MRLMPQLMKPTSPTPISASSTRLGREHAELLDLVVLRGGHEADLHARLQRAVEHAHDDDHAAIRVVPGVEDQRLERRVGIALRRRHARDHRLEDLADAAALLGAGQQRPGAVEADDLLDLPAGLVGLGAGQVDLVDDRDDLEAAVDGQVGVGQGLRLDALRGVDQQQRALARRQRPGHLVAEVDVAGRVDQVEDVALAVVGRVVEAHRVRLDGDAPLALQVHAVEDLRLHLAGLQRAGDLEEAVGQGRLAVVDVRHDGEVADEALFRHVGAGEPSIMAHPPASRPAVTRPAPDDQALIAARAAPTTAGRPGRCNRPAGGSAGCWRAAPARARSSPRCGSPRRSA